MISFFFTFSFISIKPYPRGKDRELKSMTKVLAMWLHFTSSLSQNPFNKPSVGIHTSNDVLRYSHEGHTVNCHRCYLLCKRKITC